MNITFYTESEFGPSGTYPSAEEYLFLNPDGVRTIFPIGWEGKGRYVKGSLRLYRASDNSLIDRTTYHETESRIFFEFNTAPAAGSYTDIIVRYLVDPIDYAFSQGTSDSAYPGEEYFLFPNWRNAKGCNAAFWIGKYAASRDDATDTSQGTGTIPVSKKGKCCWVNTALATQMASCPTKGAGFHCMRNREWVSIALWTNEMGIEVYGNMSGLQTGGTNIDTRGIGTDITPAMADNTDAFCKILTGSGPASFRHNGKMGGISDLVGNVDECIDGIQLRNGKPYVFNATNTAYEALNTSDITSWSHASNSKVYNYINNSTDELLDEGLPVESAGLKVTDDDLIWKNNSGTFLLYRGCDNYWGTGTGIWSFDFSVNVSSSSASGSEVSGFRLARDLYI